MNPSSLATLFAAAFVLAGQSQNVFAQESNGLAELIIAAGMELVPDTGCSVIPGLADRCGCRNIAAVVSSYDQPNLLKGPRMVYGEDADWKWGTMCDHGRGNSPIEPGKLGGIMGGNSDGSVETGVEGTFSYDIYQEDGKKLDCKLAIYVDNSVWMPKEDEPEPVKTDARVNAELKGSECSGLEYKVGQTVDNNTGGGAQIWVWWKPTNGGQKNRKMLEEGDA